MKEKIKNKNKHGLSATNIIEMLDNSGVWIISPSNSTGIQTIRVKPMSVNEAWQGKRFKTKKYLSYSKEVLYLLPKSLTIPNPPFEIYYKFGFSSSASDYDNAIKPLQDLIAKKYRFDDKLIRRAVIETEYVKKGKEYIQFKITHYEGKT